MPRLSTIIENGNTTKLLQASLAAEKLPECNTDGKDKLVYINDEMIVILDVTNADLNKMVEVLAKFDVLAPEAGDADKTVIGKTGDRYEYVTMDSLNPDPPGTVRMWGETIFGESDKPGENPPDGWDFWWEDDTKMKVLYPFGLEPEHVGGEGMGNQRYRNYHIIKL